MEAKEKIQASAQELFIQYGIRSVTMDDVARATSMSKKTLYQYFENKNALVSEVAKNHFEQDQKEFMEIETGAHDAVDEILKVSKCLRRHIFRMNPSLLYDMQKYHGSVWEIYLKFKQTTIQGHIQRNIERGQSEGYFRKEIDAKIMSICRVEQVQLVFDPKIFPTNKFDFREIQIQIFDHFIHGLFTDKGRKKYEAYNTNELLNHTL